MSEHVLLLSGQPPAVGVSVNLMGDLARFFGMLYPGATLGGVEPRGTFALRIPDDEYLNRPQLTEDDWQGIAAIIERAREETAELDE